MGFLRRVPKGDGAGYLHLNWNHIPGMYCWKHYIWTLVIEQKEWAHLSNPTLLAQYWEPTHEPKDFHCTFALVLCRTGYYNCEDKSWRKEFVASVVVVRKPTHHVGIPFSLVATEFREPTKTTPTLLIVWLHHRL